MLGSERLGSGGGRGRRGLGSGSLAIERLGRRGWRRGGWDQRGVGLGG